MSPEDFNEMLLPINSYYIICQFICIFIFLFLIKVFQCTGENFIAKCTNKWLIVTMCQPCYLAVKKITIVICKEFCFNFSSMPYPTNFLKKWSKSVSPHYLVIFLWQIELFIELVFHDRSSIFSSIKIVL